MIRGMLLRGLARWHLLLLLLGGENLAVNGQFESVCGKDYTDANNNCAANPKCPSGDGCPPEKGTCFAIPTSNCPDSPAITPAPVMGSSGSTMMPSAVMPATDSTDVPTASVMGSMMPTANEVPEVLHVCGGDFLNAARNCDTNVQCPDNDMSLCPPQTACFSIKPEQCVTTEPPTLRPTTPERLHVCGSSNTDATENCLTNALCPNFNGCPPGQACFLLPVGSCPPEMPEVSNSPTAATGASMMPTAGATTPAPVVPVSTLSPTEGPPPDFIYVCGDGYMDALNNCRTNLACPTGDGCLVGSCFAISYSECPEPVPTLSPIVETIAPTISTAAPTDGTPEPTMPPVEPLPTLSPTLEGPPDFVYVCGDGYMDALDNCRTNMPCPTGDGCLVGSCYAIAYAECPMLLPTPSPIMGTGSDTISPTMMGSAELTMAATTAPISVTSMPTETPTTEKPTKSPTYNTLFCGTTYMEAERDCFINQPCPTGSGCPTGQACFGITTERCISGAPTGSPTDSGPQPTGNPTITPVPTDFPTMTNSPSNPQTMDPTKSPTLNTNFCGARYIEAVDNCDYGSACPDGFTCPPGLTCFPGIICPRTTKAPSPPTNPPTEKLITSPPSPGMSPPSFGMSPPSPGMPSPGMPSPPNAVFPTQTMPPQMGMSPDMPTMETSPTTNRTDPSLPVPTTGMAPAPLPAPVNDRFCGSSVQDAQINCATNFPCPDGMSTSCLPSQTCFTGIQCAAEPMTAMPPTLSPFDPNNDKFCGSNYTQANVDCYYNPPCPDGFTCPGGLTCFVGITCEVPPPDPTNAPTVTPAPTIVGGLGATDEPTSAEPSKSPTPRPVFDFESNFNSGANGSCSLSSKSLTGLLWTVGGALAAFALTFY